MRGRKNRQIRSAMGRRRLVRVASAALALVCLTSALASPVGGPHEGRSQAQLLLRRAVPIDQPGTRLSRARLARSAISWSGGATTASTGETVTVYLSASMPPELGTPQSWADFIAGLEHGSELSSLTTYVATFVEMQEICGEDALGCYGPDHLMTSGETVYGVTPAEVVRHEYGHHIAFHRLNPPWSAIDWGPKNWASTVSVCRRTKQGNAYPGDEGANYSLNPGEAWAETYRALQEKRSGAPVFSWDIVDGSFYPDDAAFQVAERDVLQPWAASRHLAFKQTFKRESKRVWTIPLTTPLDGSLEVTVSLPKSGLQDVSLLSADRKTVLATGLWSSQRTKTLTTTVCGERSLFLRVTQKGAFGRVVVSTSLP